MPRLSVMDSLRADVHAVVEKMLDEVLQAWLDAKAARQLSLQCYIPNPSIQEPRRDYGGGPDRIDILKGLVLTYLIGEHDLSVRQFDGLLAELRREIRGKWLREREDFCARLAAQPEPKPSEQDMKHRAKKLRDA